jgi:hypothetical protein
LKPVNHSFFKHFNRFCHILQSKYLIFAGALQSIL